ncbi:unnamed protein product [Rodentolepis nana]|uniref:SH3 domain-containing protein n=1 Tax=Rodentolepis nana TaxID=102285 RepID=A0A158QIZ0_RODNA|nr:unnamed protein product [Rodentolepis nana]
MLLSLVIFLFITSNHITDPPRLSLSPPPTLSNPLHDTQLVASFFVGAAGLFHQLLNMDSASTFYFRFDKCNTFLNASSRAFSKPFISSAYTSPQKCVSKLGAHVINTQIDYKENSFTNLLPCDETPMKWRYLLKRRYEERTKLEEALFTINLLTKELHAKAYVPTNPQLKLAAISSAWQTLEHTEHDYEEAIRNAYLRLEKYDKIVRKFEHKASLREDWLTEMEDLSESLQKAPGTQIGSARKAEALRMEIESKEKRFKELDNLATEIGRYREYRQGTGVLQLNGKIQNRWSNLSGPKMRALLARLAFPQTRADLLQQLEVMTKKIKELETQLTHPTKGEIEAKKNGEKTLSLEVIQAALDRHRLAEAEFLPLERKFLQTQIEKASDFKKCQTALQLWNRVSEQSRGRKSRLDSINSSYNLSASLTNELNWVEAKIDYLSSTVSLTKDPQNARDLKLAQRSCKKHQAMESEVNAHEALWEDLKRTAEQFISTRSANGSIDESSLADTLKSIRSQVAGVTSAWNHLQQEMKARQDALNECLESAQFYADADEASRWIQEKIHLVESAGILRHPVEGDQELDKALKLCGMDSSSTMAQKRRLTNLQTEMNAFQSNDLQRLKYYSTLLRKPTESSLIRPERIAQNKDDESSDIDSDNEFKANGSQIAGGPSTTIEGRAQAIARYIAKDPAGRDIDLEKGEMVALIACTNADWWHVRRNVRGQRNEGFVPANRLKLLVAPVVRKKSSNAEALKVVKREATRGLSIRRTPSARTSSQLHFDKENIFKCEQRVMQEFDQLQKCVRARDNCLQDTLAWHDFAMKCNNFDAWMAQKVTDQLQRDSRNMKNHGPEGMHVEASSNYKCSLQYAATIEEISKGAPLLAEITELAGILSGNVRPSERSLYKRGSGDLFYKKLALKRMNEIQNQWVELNKRRSSLESILAGSGSLRQFDKLADTMETLLEDRIIQLEAMPSTAPNKEASNDLLRKVRAIKIEKPSLNEKLSRLRSTGNSVVQNHPSDAASVKSRLQGIDKSWFKLQELLKRREEAYATAVADMDFREKMADLEVKLNDAEEQISLLVPCGEITANKTVFQNLLPSDVLKERLRRADDIDDDLNIYDADSAELCEQVKRLPEGVSSKENLRKKADQLALNNEKLKRDLEGKRDDLVNSIKSQAFAVALDAIEGNIREQDTRLQMTEPLASLTDVEREKRRIDQIKIELLKNITSIAVNEERIEGTKFPKELNEPLMIKCKSVRDVASGVMKRAESREDEVERVKTHANFHDDASDLKEWLDEKRVAVDNIPTSITGTDPMEALRQIRGRLKKLEDIDAELTANEKALEDWRYRSDHLPSCSDAINFPSPQKRIEDIDRKLADLQGAIVSKSADLSKAEIAAQFNSDANQLIKASLATTQQSAIPKEFTEEEENQPLTIPRTYIEAVDALNDSKRRRQKLADDLAKLNALEEKAKRAGALTPTLVAQLGKERERNDELVGWYSLADEMEMLKNWADTQFAQVQKDLRGRSTSRTTQDYDGQRKVHERLKDEKKRRDSRVQQLLDAKQRPIPRSWYQKLNEKMSPQQFYLNP